jgi:hypothetical protein
MEGVMLTRESRLDSEVVTWIVGLDAALVLEMLPEGDDFPKCVAKPASRPAVAIHASIRTALKWRLRRPVEEVRRRSLGGYQLGWDVPTGRRHL